MLPSRQIYNRVDLSIADERWRIEDGNDMQQRNGGIQNGRKFTILLNQSNVINSTSIKMAQQRKRNQENAVLHFLAHFV